MLVKRRYKNLKIFISCSFNSSTKSIIDLTKSICKMYRMDAFVSGETEPNNLPESISRHIKGSDAFFAIVSKEQSPWVQSEIGIAYEADIPIYAIVEEGSNLGILKHITIYKPFKSNNEKIIIEAISEVVRKINDSRTEENAEIYKLFKNKRERVIYEIGTHAAASQIFILLTLNDLNPLLYNLYQNVHEKELERLTEELKLLE